MKTMTSIACLGAIALGGLASVHVPHAVAACATATSQVAQLVDSPVDGDDGLAPEIGTVRAAVGSACTYAVDPGLLQPTLVDGESVFVYIDRDGDPNTGSQTFRGADVVVGTLGAETSSPLLGTWNGTRFAFDDPAPVGPATALGGFTASLDRLGVVSGATTRVYVGAMYSGVYDDYFDFAPGPLQAPLALGVGYATPPPPPPPPVAPVWAPPAPAPAPRAESPGSPATVCRVPKVNRLRVSDAEDRLWAAECRWTVRRVFSGRVRRGRVVSTNPAAGRSTSARVVVSVSRGPRSARARAAGVDVARDLQRLARLVRSAEQTATQG